MYKWTKKIHMYAGLLSFTAFIVWGVAGLLSVTTAAPDERLPPTPSVRYLDFQVDGDADDQ